MKAYRYDILGLAEMRWTGSGDLNNGGRMENSRKIKSVMLGIMDGKGRHGRPNMEWIDNIKEWCNKDLYSLTISALDRKLWKQTIKFALDTYGLSAHGS